MYKSENSASYWIPDSDANKKKRSALNSNKIQEEDDDSDRQPSFLMDPEELEKRARKRDCCKRICPCFYLRSTLTNSEQALKWLKNMLSI